MTHTGPLRFGLVGCGTIARTHADAIQSLGTSALTACCDIVPGAAFAFADRHGIPPEHTHTSLHALLDDPEVDAVTVCTPSGLHAQIAVQCLEAGLPTIVEKPVDISPGACELLVGIQKQTGVPLAVISQHRFDQASLYAKETIASGRLGKLLMTDMSVKWHRSQEYYDSAEWRGTWALDGGGALMNQGVHTVDLMRWIAGPVHSVWAVARTAAHRDIEVEDSVCATLAFENGAIGSLIASTAVSPGFPASLGLYGTLGTIVITADALESVYFVDSGDHEQERASAQPGGALHAVQVAQGGTRSAEASKSPIPAAASGWQWGDAHRAQIADFVQCVRDGTTPVVDAAEGKLAVDLILAIYESARTGQVVNLL